MTMRLQPGSEFAGFRVQRRLGVGGMSEVYLFSDAATIG